jgi:hypothetical protein
VLARDLKDAALDTLDIGVVRERGIVLRRIELG